MTKQHTFYRFWPKRSTTHFWARATFGPPKTTRDRRLRMPEKTNCDHHFGRQLFGPPQKKARWRTSEAKMTPTSERDLNWPVSQPASQPVEVAFCQPKRDQSLRNHSGPLCDCGTLLGQKRGAQTLRDECGRGELSAPANQLNLRANKTHSSWPTSTHICRRLKAQSCKIMRHGAPFSNHVDTAAAPPPNVLHGGCLAAGHVLECIWRAGWQAGKLAGGMQINCMDYIWRGNICAPRLARGPRSRLARLVAEQKWAGGKKFKFKSGPKSELLKRGRDFHLAHASSVDPHKADRVSGTLANSSSPHLKTLCLA